MTIFQKLLFTAISCAFVFLGAVTISNESHTGSTKYSGIVTLVGSDAVAFGHICIVIGLLPLVVWLPKRWVLAASCTWGITLLGAIFLPLFLR